MFPVMHIPSRSCRSTLVFSCYLSRERLPDRILQDCQSLRDLRAETHAQEPPAALVKHFEISARLCRLDDAKGVPPRRHIVPPSPPLRYFDRDPRSPSDASLIVSTEL
jgi:hypothetical protein